MSSYFDKAKSLAKRVPWWGWLLGGSGVLLLLGEGASAAGYNFNAATQEAQDFIDSLRNKDDVEDWATQAIDALIAAGVDLTTIYPGDLLIIARGESGGDPTITQQIQDVNSATHPAQGLMQVIQPTFDQYRLDSLPDDIFNPVSNIAASVQYILHRYHGTQGVPGVIKVQQGLPYQGY